MLQRCVAFAPGAAKRADVTWTSHCPAVQETSEYGEYGEYGVCPFLLVEFLGFTYWTRTRRCRGFSSGFSQTRDWNDWTLRVGRAWQVLVGRSVLSSGVSRGVG